MAVYFPRTASDHLYKASLTSLNTPLTICCWFKVDDVTSAHGLVGYIRAEWYNWGFYSAVKGDIANDPITAYGSVGTSTYYSGKTPVSAGTWMHSASVFSASNSRLAYLNGVAGTVNTNSLDPGGCTRMTIGRTWLGISDSYCKGAVAEVAIWNTALSSGAISAMAGGAYASSYETNLLYYWTFLEDYTEFYGGPTFGVGGGSPYITSDHPPVGVIPFGPKIQII